MGKPPQYTRRGRGESHYLPRGTGIRGLMRGMATLPQGNQELLVVKDKVGRPPGEHGISKSRLHGM